MSAGATGVAEAIVLLVIVGVALSSLARRIGIPEPVVLVAGGVGLAFIPGLPSIPLEPELVLLVFVAPCSTWTATSRPCASCAATPCRSGCWPRCWWWPPPPAWAWWPTT